MSALVAASTYRLVHDIDQADVAVLNTCGFITDAVEESIATALELADWRDARSGRALIVTGCMVSRYGHELADAMSEADAFVSVADESTLLEVVERLTSAAPAPTAGPARMAGGVSEYLQVADGCHRACAYCTIPAIRGEYRSHSLDQLATEAELLVSRGAKEIVLIGQDTSSWGRDLTGDDDIATVIQAVAAVPGLEWLRVMYVQPDTVSARLIDTLASLDPVRHYLDIPLQHVSPTVLRAMHRTGSAETFLALIDRLRTAMPDIALRSTFIAGFPGETESDLDMLLDFISEAALDYVGVFPFSPEEGTAAAHLPDQLVEAERLERASRIREAADSVSLTRAARRIGAVVDVLSEGLDPEGFPIGRWSGQAPEVDGYVMLDRAVAPGRIIPVRIDASYGYDLEGEVIA
jgi:ribosomal protein S12 methylthiotransferase